LHGWVILLRGPGASSLTRMGIASDREWARGLSLHTEAIDQVAACYSMVGDSPGIRRVLTQIYTVAPTDAPVLVTGETGTGKELVARAIHEHSPRAARRFVRVNCAAVPRELFESEFFGHARGAFTGAVADRAGRFESADGGTLFLDEIGELPLELQGKLLTVLQAGEFERLGEGRVRQANVRLIAATNRSLEHELAAGRFRSDLYYRLSVFPIAVPPLRQRKEDIPLLVAHILAGCARKLGYRIPDMPAADVLRLMEHPWPGNVRELQNVLERASIEARSGEALRMELSGPAPAVAPTVELGAPPAILTEAERRDRYRREVVSALERAQGRIAGPRGAAALLGLKPTTLRSRIQALGIELASVARLGAASGSHGRDVTVTPTTAGGV
jgi:transcriptional regulator with GAF, ATPase, and Fis domain